MLLVSNSGEQPSVTGNFGPSIKLEEYKGRPYRNLPTDFTAWGLLMALATSGLSNRFFKYMEKEEGAKKSVVVGTFVCLLITTVLGLILLAGPPLFRIFGYVIDRPPPVSLIEKRPSNSANY